MHVLSLSYGKDSLACLGAIEKLNLPIDRAVHCEVMATSTIPADLPPMMEFKAKADKIIKDRWGITVEHITAGVSYEDVFYRKFSRGKRQGEIYGFPCIMGAWCNSRLKVKALDSFKDENVITYIGIANDEPVRLARLKKNMVAPLALAEWTEQDCYNWCKENDLLSPIYTDSARGGCWFCHNQPVDQLRLLRKNYPEYWAMLLKWDKDSPTTFKFHRTVHDYEERFSLEDEGIINPDDRFYWDCLKNGVQMKLL